MLRISAAQQVRMVALHGIGLQQAGKVESIEMLPKAGHSLSDVLLNLRAEYGYEQKERSHINDKCDSKGTCNENLNEALLLRGVGQAREITTNAAARLP